VTGGVTGGVVEEEKDWQDIRAIRFSIGDSVDAPQRGPRRQLTQDESVRDASAPGG
jgi:hypothetical protein